MEQNKQMMKQQGITVTFEQAAKDWLAARAPLCQAFDLCPVCPHRLTGIFFLIWAKKNSRDWMRRG